MNKIKITARWLVHQLQRNAVVLIPLAISIVEATKGLTWRAALPVVGGIVLRQFFTSPTAEVKEREDLAHGEGVEYGKFIVSQLIQSKVSRSTPVAPLAVDPLEQLKGLPPVG